MSRPARGRMTRRSVATDERLAQLSSHSLALYLMSLPWQDRDGRTEGHPARVRGLHVPALAAARPGEWSDEHVDSYMEEWTRTVEEGALRPLVVRYGVAGVAVCAFPGFAKNQQIRYEREAASTLPDPPGGLLESLPHAVAAAIAPRMPLRGAPDADSGQQLTIGLDADSSRPGMPFPVVDPDADSGRPADAVPHQPDAGLSKVRSYSGPELKRELERKPPEQTVASYAAREEPALPDRTRPETLLSDPRWHRVAAVVRRYARGRSESEVERVVRTIQSEAVPEDVLAGLLALAREVRLGRQEHWQEPQPLRPWLEHAVDRIRSAAAPEQPLPPAAVELLERLIELLPDREPNTREVLEGIFRHLPPHCIEQASEELRAASGVRRPSAYLVRIGQRMLAEATAA